MVICFNTHFGKVIPQQLNGGFEHLKLVILGIYCEQINSRDLKINVIQRQSADGLRGLGDRHLAQKGTADICVGRAIEIDLRSVRDEIRKQPDWSASVTVPLDVVGQESRHGWIALTGYDQ